MKRQIKTLYFDVETTGKDPVNCAIVQISGIIEIDKEIVDSFNFNVRPHQEAVCEEEAMTIIGKNIEEVKNYSSIPSIYTHIMAIFEKYVNKYDREDKFYPAGYNVSFDLDFLQQFVKRVQRAYNQKEYGIGSYINWRYIDVMQIAYNIHYLGKLQLPDFKLGTLCEFYRIPLKAHDSLSDIRATRELYYKLIKELTHEK